MVLQAVTWYDPACMAMTLKSPQIQSRSIHFSEWVCSQAPLYSINMLLMLIVLRTIYNLHY